VAHFSTTQETVKMQWRRKLRLTFVGTYASASSITSFITSSTSWNTGEMKSSWRYWNKFYSTQHACTCHVNTFFTVNYEDVFLLHVSGHTISRVAK
jgi:hypothetical protein